MIQFLLRQQPRINYHVIKVFRKAIAPLDKAVHRLTSEREPAQPHTIHIFFHSITPSAFAIALASTKHFRNCHCFSVIFGFTCNARSRNSSMTFCAPSSFAAFMYCSIGLFISIPRRFKHYKFFRAAYRLQPLTLNHLRKLFRRVLFRACSYRPS